MGNFTVRINKKMNSLTKRIYISN